MSQLQNWPKKTSFSSRCPSINVQNSTFLLKSTSQSQKQQEMFLKSLVSINVWKIVLNSSYHLAYKLRQVNNYLKKTDFSVPKVDSCSRYADLSLLPSGCSDPEVLSNAVFSQLYNPLCAGQASSLLVRAVFYALTSDGWLERSVKTHTGQFRVQGKKRKKVDRKQ